jgi:plasmid stabilization system protein ParE
MKLRYAEQALARLNHQIQYLIERNALSAAEQLSDRVAHYLENSLLIYPKTGRYIPEKSLWETWIPRTKIVVWYVFDDHELVIIDVWHTSQGRDAD